MTWNEERFFETWNGTVTERVTLENSLKRNGTSYKSRDVERNVTSYFSNGTECITVKTYLLAVNVT